MALTYDTRELDFTSISEWFAAHDYDEKHDNYTLFETLIFRLMVLRPSNDGTIRAAEAKTVMIRNRVWEMSDKSVHIPDEFIRRMIGLKTNIFPKLTDEMFDAQMGRIFRESIEFNMPDGWDNF